MSVARELRSLVVSTRTKDCKTICADSRAIAFKTAVRRLVIDLGADVGTLDTGKYDANHPFVLNNKRDWGNVSRLRIECPTVEPNMLRIVCNWRDRIYSAKARGKLTC